MTAEVTTVIGQLNIKGGHWRDEAPDQVAVREPKTAGRPGAGKGDLFVLAEVLGDKPNLDAIEQKLAQTIRDSYYLARGSITASLRRALQVAGDQIYQYNRRVGLEERVVAGVVAVVMHNDDAFVAQAGPAAFFAVQGRDVHRCPAQSTASEDRGEEETALGLRPFVEPNLYHVHVTPADKLLLANSTLAGRLRVDEVANAVVAGNVKTAVKNLGRTAGGDEGSALLLEVVEKAGGRPPLSGVAAAGLGKFWPGKRTPEGTPRPETVTTGAAGRFNPLPQIKPMTQWLYGVLKRPEPATAGETVSAERQGKISPPSRPTHQSYDFAKAAPPPKSSPPPREAATVMASAAAQPAMAAKPKVEPKIEEGRPFSFASTIGGAVRWVGAAIWMALALLGGGLKNLLGLILPGTESNTPRQAGQQAYRPHNFPISPTMLRNIALLIPLLIIVIVAITYLQQGRQKEAEYQALLANAENKFQQAQAVAPNFAVGLMAEAEGYLNQAAAMKEGIPQPEIDALRAKMAQEADRIGKVVRLTSLAQLRQYTDSGTSLKSVLIQGVDVFVMDIGADRVYHHRLNDTGTTLLPDDESLLLAARGQKVEELEVSDLYEMTWMPAGGSRQTSDLLALGSHGLLEYNPNWGLTTAQISGLTELGKPAGVSNFFGNFYVLAPEANRLWRYRPTTDGYNTSPESYFPADEPVNLTNAVDFAIDGAVYVLFQDGRIEKFEGGRKVTFNLSGLDMPLNNPVSIFTAPDEEVQYLYVADAGNRRVVQFNKDGAFVRQFKPAKGGAVSFGQLQDIFVDEIGGRLYALDGNSLYVATLQGE